MRKMTKKLTLSRETLAHLTLEDGALRPVAAGVSAATCPLACTVKNNFCIGT
jgi:hypothetical protein